MADGDAVPDTTNWAEWVHSRALQAITGDVVDMRRLSQAQWFLFNPAASSNTWDYKKGPPPKLPNELSYHAFGKQYFGADINHAAIADWEKTADTLTTISNDINNGVRGTMDARQLDRMHTAVVQLEKWLDTRSGEYRKWSSSLNLNTSEFRGSAAYVLQKRMDRYADMLEMWRNRLRTGFEIPLSTAVGDAHAALKSYTFLMWHAWYTAVDQNIRNKIREAINAENKALYDYMVAKGLIAGTDQYLFDKWDPWRQDPNGIVYQSQVDAFLAKVDSYINTTLATYPKGDLRTAAPWIAMNKTVTDSVKPQLDFMDRSAAAAMEGVRNNYVILTKVAAPLPPPKNSPGGPPPGWNGNPNFPNFNFAPPNFNFTPPNLNFTPPNLNFTPPNLNFAPLNLSPNGLPNLSLGPNGLGGPNGLPNLTLGAVNPPGGPGGLGGPNVALPNLPPGEGPGAGPGFTGNAGPLPPGSVGGAIPTILPAGGPAGSPGGNGLTVGPDGLLLGPDGLPLSGAGLDVLPRDVTGLGLVGPGLGGPGFGTLAATGGPGLPGDQLGPLGELLDPATGQPQLGEFGELLGRDGLPLLGSLGQLLAPGGASLLGPEGELRGADGAPLLGELGQLLGPDGSSLLGLDGELLGPDGQSLVGSDGLFIGPDGQSITPGQRRLDPGGGLLFPGGPGVGDPGVGGLLSSAPPSPGGFVAPPVQVGADGLLLPDRVDPGGALFPGGGPGGGGLVPAGAHDTPGAGMLPGGEGPSLPGEEFRLDDWGGRIGADGATGIGGPQQPLLTEGQRVVNPGLWPPGQSGPLPSQMAGSPMSMGGMPFMPGMGYGGIGGFGGRDDRRERKTWLKEDEKVWGTHLAPGDGLVGRPDDEAADVGVEEFALPAGPVRQPRRLAGDEAAASGTEGWDDRGDGEGAEPRHRPGRAE